MKMEEYISFLTESYCSEQDLRALRLGIPLGKDEEGNVVLSQKRERPYTVRLTCVTGEKKTEFISHLLVTFACLYRADELNVLLISPENRYSALLGLRGYDVSVPFIRNKSDIETVKTFLKELSKMHDTQRGCPRLLLVLDGLENLPDFGGKGDLEEYRQFFELLARRTDVDVIAGVNLSESMFSGFPGAFVGISNTLVTVEDSGVAGVTYVEEDCSLSDPVTLRYPASPSLEETVVALNALSQSQSRDKQ